MLRLLVGLTTIDRTIDVVSGTPNPGAIEVSIASAALIAAAFVIAGLFTPASSALVAAVLLADRGGAASLAVVALAMILLGPGALSIDAWWFGRREIVFDGHPQPPQR